MTLTTLIKTSSVRFSFLVLFCFNTKVNAQSAAEKGLIAKMEEVYKKKDVKQLDSIYNTMKKQALELGLDSLYVELTFQQIDKNGGPLLYTNTEILLEDLLQNEHYFLKDHPKLLLRCVHDLGYFNLLQSNSSQASRKISEQYYKRYFNLLKQIKLSGDELETERLNKLNYLVYTENDSLFYFLKRYKIDKKKEAEFLNHWYRRIQDYKKELDYAKILDDKIKIIIALKNNKEFEKINLLYPNYVETFKKTDPIAEHKLYLIMGQIYIIHKRYSAAEKMCLKALKYFEEKKSNLYTDVIYNDLIKIKMEMGDLQGYSYYSNKLAAQKKEYKEQQLGILKNLLEYRTKSFDYEIQLNLNEEKLVNETLNNKIKNQKNLISFALALLIVTLVFVYFYSVNSKTKAELEDANKQMVIDVLRSKFKPHFTFNVLSVINYFVEKKELQNATLALTKMSSLLRSTLDNMNEKLVPFLSEYKICQNYMYLESLRFSDKFDFEFEPINNLTVEQWLIPPGIIEPFLENAVNHAFTGVKQKGKIILHHKIEDNKLIITVKDNGIGMKVSPLNNKKRHGLKITKDYIGTVSKLYKSPITLKISSKKGTTVEISIPKLNPYIVA